MADSQRELVFLIWEWIEKNGLDPAECEALITLERDLYTCALHPKAIPLEDVTDSGCRFCAEAPKTLLAPPTPVTMGRPNKTQTIVNVLTEHGPMSHETLYEWMAKLFDDDLKHAKAMTSSLLTHLRWKNRVLVKRGMLSVPKTPPKRLTSLEGRRAQAARTATPEPLKPKPPKPTPPPKPAKPRLLPDPLPTPPPSPPDPPPPIRAPQPAAPIQRMPMPTALQKKYVRMEKSDELDLLVRARFGDQKAEQALVAQNIPFIVSLATKYARKGGQDIVGDLVAEGSIGLTEAVRRFDLYQDVRFITFAGSWALLYIRRWLANQSTILSGGRNAKEALRRAKLGLTRKEVTTAAAQNAFRSLSLDAPIATIEFESTLGDTVADQSASVESQVGDLETSAWVKRVVSEMSLNAVERLIVEDRLMGSATLEDIGKRVGLSRERIRQIHEKLLPRLRKRFRGEPEARFLERAFEKPKPTPESPAPAVAAPSKPASVVVCVGCTHPEEWHATGICYHCGCDRFRPRLSLAERASRDPRFAAIQDERALSRALRTDSAPMLDTCPAARPNRRGPCGKPAVWGEWCVVHGQRVERGIPVTRFAAATIRG